MPAPVHQAEIQLGHLCNNRCVFCVSGQLTHTRAAPLLDPAELTASIREARAAGATSLTFLGGEPTIQPFFLDLVREAVRLEFDEIVIFSNGSKSARTDLVDQVAATGTLTGECRRNCPAVVAAEDLRDVLVALPFVDLVDADAAV